MSLFFIDKTDKRLKDISRDHYDCFMFDMFTMKEFNRIITGKSVILNRFILEHSQNELGFNRNRHILSKVRTIRNITRNNTYSNTFLVFQTISWKSSKKKMPYILIPVRIFDDGTKIVRNGEIIINPMVLKELDTIVYKPPKRYKNFHSLDSPELAKIIESENGRILYEMYLTHFLVEYPKVSSLINTSFERALPTESITTRDSSLLFLDRESEAIRQVILRGGNVIVNAVKGTNRYALIADLLYDSIMKGKSVLFLSEVENTFLHNYLIDCGVNKFINDDNNTTYHLKGHSVTKHPDSSNKYDYLRERILVYQENMRMTVKSFQLNNLMRDYLLLEDYDHPGVVIERLDELSNQDVQIIRRILRQLETTAFRMKLDNPSESHWYDLDLRMVRGSSKEFVEALEKCIQQVNHIEVTKNELVNRFKLKLPNDIDGLFDGIQQYDYIRPEIYPTNWYRSDHFSQVKEHLLEATNMVGRVYSLHHTLLVSYHESILEHDLQSIYKNVAEHEFFSLDSSEINRLLNDEMVVDQNLNDIYEIAKTLVHVTKDLEEFYDINQNDAFHELVTDMSYILTNGLMKKRWFATPKDQLKRVLEILNNKKDLLQEFMNLSDELKDFLLPSITEIDEEILLHYQDSLRVKGQFGFQPEHVYSKQIVQQHVKEGYDELTKQLKRYLIAEALKWKQMYHEAVPLIKEIQQSLDVTVTLQEMEELRHIITVLLKYDWQRKHLVYTPAQIDQLKFLDGEYKKTVNTLRSYLEVNKLTYLFTTSLNELRNRFSSFKEFIEVIRNAKREFLYFFKNDVSTITIQTMRSITNTLNLYHRSNEELLSREELYQDLFSTLYKGIHTDFKHIQFRISTFESVKSLFQSDDALLVAFETNSINMIRSSLKTLVIGLQSLLGDLDKLDSFYTHPIMEKTFDGLQEYLRQFSSLSYVDLWVHLMDDLQKLRNYYQLRFVALINTGSLNHSFVQYFERGLYKALIEEVGVIPSSHDYLMLDEFHQSTKELEESSIVSLSRRRFLKRVQMSSIYAYNLFEKKEYDVLIVDGAEKIHQNVLRQLSKNMSQFVILYDANEPVQYETIPRFLVKYPTFHLQNNYQKSLLLEEKQERGVIYSQSFLKIRHSNIVDTVLSRIEKQQYVNIVCSRNDMRLSLFDVINDRIQLLATNNEEYLDYIGRIHILLAMEHHPRSDSTIIIYDSEISQNQLYRILTNAKDILIVDEDNLLQDEQIYNKLIAAPIDLYAEVEDPFLLWFIKKMELQNAVIRKALQPYDLITFNDEGVQTLIKIAYHEKENSDILEDTLMMYHSAYEDANKIVVTIGDVYHNTENTMKTIREMMKRGKR